MVDSIDGVGTVLNPYLLQVCLVHRFSVIPAADQRPDVINPFEDRNLAMIVADTCLGDICPCDLAEEVGVDDVAGCATASASCGNETISVLSDPHLPM